MSDVLFIFLKFLDGTLIGENRVVFCLFQVLLEKSSLTTVSSCTENVTELLRIHPNPAVVVHLLFYFIEKFSDKS